MLTLLLFPAASWRIFLLRKPDCKGLESKGDANILALLLCTEQKRAATQSLHSHTLSLNYHFFAGRE